MTLITIIGRGHSGTRALSQTLYASNVFMGRRINPSCDLVPPEPMYDACRIIAKYVDWKGGLDWDWEALHHTDIDKQFKVLVYDYLSSVLGNTAQYKGWKLPETTLVFPWIVRLFPEAKYIHCIRNPRDCILKPHNTDDLSKFGISGPTALNERHQRAISWKYQYDLVKATPKPSHFLEVRFEDFILKQPETLARLEEFLEIPLARIVVRPESVGRYKIDSEQNYFDFFESAMKTHGY